MAIPAVVAETRQAAAECETRRPGRGGRGAPLSEPERPLEGRGASVMRHFAFVLSMPGRASWNGNWSGSGQAHVRVRTFNTRSKAAPEERAYYYHWSDGWCACVTVREVDASEARRLRKATAGFSGYDWMVDSIIEHGEIRA